MHDSAIAYVYTVKKNADTKVEMLLSMKTRKSWSYYSDLFGGMDSDWEGTWQVVSKW